MKTKQLLIVIAILGGLCTTNAQSLTKVKQDSLADLWKDSSQLDSLRLNALQELILFVYRRQNADSTLFYAQKQYDLATATDNKKAVIQALHNQSYGYLMISENDKALDALTTSLQLSEEIDHNGLTIASLGSIAEIFVEQGEIEKFLDYNEQIIALCKEAGDKAGEGKAIMKLGNHFISKGDFVQGLEYLDSAKKIFIEIGDTYSENSTKMTIAKIYLQQGETEKALEVLLECQKYYQETNNQLVLAGIKSNLGAVYADLGDTKKGLEHFEEAKKDLEKMGMTMYAATIAQNIARIYGQQGDQDKALVYLRESLALYEQNKQIKSIALAKQRIAMILSTQGKHAQAIAVGNEALQTFEELEDMGNIRNSSGSLIRSYKALGDYKGALEMTVLNTKMRDSLNSEKNQKAIIELQVQSDYDKQKAIDDLENQKEVAVQEEKTKAQQRVSWAIGIGLLLISVLAFMIFNRLKITRKQKAIIEEQKKKVEQSEKYKEQFLANMSHEIRTPMHAISGMLKILERNDHPATQDLYLKAMQTSSDNLVVILNDVLDLSKIEAGKLDVESIPMNPSQVVENVVQILKFKAEEKGLLLSSSIDPSVPELVLGDPTRLNQILVNLAGNAIKFTEKGSIVISLTTTNNNLEFSVKDTGVGISKNDQQQIFEAFTQASDTTARTHGGTGLGLNISKQLIQLQNGSIWLESELGQGSTFYTSLPLVLPDADAIVQDLVSEDEIAKMAASLKGIRILIAEDNPFNQMIAEDDLSFYLDGVSIEIVNNGALAVQKFKEDSFDLILMDVQMPEMNGFEATQQIRAIEQESEVHNSTPILAMTASLLKTEIEHCFNAGMNNYIPKPYTLQELIGPIFKELRS